MQALRETTAFIIGLLAWSLFIFGPYAILQGRMPLLAILASSVALAAFALSFRWRNGYVLITGCLGVLLLLHNTVTIGGAFAFLARKAGLNLYCQIAFGLTSIAFVYVLMRFVDRAAAVILGPAPAQSAESPADGNDVG